MGAAFHACCRWSTGKLLIKPDCSTPPQAQPVQPANQALSVASMWVSQTGPLALMRPPLGSLYLERPVDGGARMQEGDEHGAERLGLLWASPSQPLKARTPLSVRSPPLPTTSLLVM